jgi:hypothetical protein
LEAVVEVICAGRKHEHKRKATVFIYDFDEIVSGGESASI